MRLSYHLLLFLPSLALAVDRSKFRTCQQTSFCRRHRNRIPRHKYRLNSVQFHPPSSFEDKVEEKKEEEKQGFFGRILNLNKFPSGENVDKFRGSAAVLTGKLNEGTRHVPLNFSVFVHSNGIWRVRITENFIRWTSDELVLNLDEMVAGKDVEELNESELKLVVDEANTSNYRGLKSGGSVLLLRLYPFEVKVLVENANGSKNEVMTLNSRNMMYFERKRSRNGEDEGVIKEEEKHGNDDEKKSKNGKEIVGYWEDGLAIYADGSREEKVDKEEEEMRLLEELEGVNQEDSEEDEDGLWTEKFHSHTDSKPNGPMSVGFDVTFPSQHLYGLPEHASQTSLKTTTGEGSDYSDPYRLYNLDVFEYELDNPMALYGSVPLLLSHTKSGTAGIFYFNPSETFVDIKRTDSSSSDAHFMSESGVLDLFLLPGPSPQDIYSQYATLTGRTPLPPMFALGYHQCRWNYRDQKDVDAVDAAFEKYDYPYDVLWLDIEHTDGKRYFTWNKDLFPEPKEMQEKLAQYGRKMVTIVDPHYKRDNNYYIHKEATSKGLYIKDKDGKNDFDGWCWPGSSSYLDFTNAKVRDWFATQFQLDRYEGSTPSLHIWNDMNEPSVFNGPEVSMQKDLLNLDGIEHREWHNLYGMLYHRATHEGLLSRQENERGFVLSRAFYAGSQRYGAVWTGDNTANWEHLAIATPMLLTLNLAGIFFSGADVGGFFENTSADLMTRWMQAGAYQPFFRGHAHHDTKRKEPWMYDEETLRRLRKVAMERYALLPYWYTVFHEGMVTGMPVMRTMWMEYPGLEEGFDIDDQFLVGGALLVKPVTEEDAYEQQVLFPTVDHWYDVESLRRIQMNNPTASSEIITVAASMDRIPVFQRGGTMVPRKLRLRRSSQLMTKDPYTLYFALNSLHNATGELYLDDEHSMEYEKGGYSLATLTADFTSGKVYNRVKTGDLWIGKSHDDLGMVERIVIMGVEKSPQSIEHNEKSISFQTFPKIKVIVIKLPSVNVLENWDINIKF